MIPVDRRTSLPIPQSTIEAIAQPDVSHSALLAETFDNLYHELTTSGNTARFLALRRLYSERLINFWSQKRQLYDNADPKLKVNGFLKGEVLVTGDESLSVLELGVYGTFDEAVLKIERETPMEHDIVTLSADLDLGLNEFLHPPNIKSEIRSDPHEPHDLEYMVVFRNGLISTVSRLRVIEDPMHQKPWIKVREEIDCSIFGVELPPSE